MFDVSRQSNIMVKDTNLTGQPVICQLMSLIPKPLVDRVVSEHRGDYYYKTMTTYRHLVFLLYGVIA